jgi:hypothetical protein
MAWSTHISHTVFMYGVACQRPILKVIWNAGQSCACMHIHAHIHTLFTDSNVRLTTGCRVSKSTKHILKCYTKATNI